MIESIPERLERLRGAIRAEDIGYGELAELADLAEHIEPGDVEMAEWAGIPEEDFAKRGIPVSVDITPRGKRSIAEQFAEDPS